MKTTAFSTALILAGSVYAGTFNSPFEVGNPDLCAGVGDVHLPAAAVQPAIGDTADASLFNTGDLAARQSGGPGSNEGYGSILIDIGHNIDW